MSVGTVGLLLIIVSLAFIFGSKNKLKTRINPRVIGFLLAILGTALIIVNFF